MARNQPAATPDDVEAAKVTQPAESAKEMLERRAAEKARAEQPKDEPVAPPAATPFSPAPPAGRYRVIRQLRPVSYRGHIVTLNPGTTLDPRHYEGDVIGTWIKARAIEVEPID